MISISKQEELFLSDIKGYLINKGFQYTKNGEYNFFKSEETRFIKIRIYFSKTGLSGNTLYSISFKAVEEIISKIGLPNNKLISGLEGYKVLITLYDKLSPFPYTDKPVLIGSQFKNERKKIESTEDVMLWKKSFIEYIEGAGEIFINKYSSLTGLLEKLNELEISGEKNYLKILQGGVDHLFRALIISKLCNDPDFEAKQSRFDSLILQAKYENWHPYYTKLKQELESTDPLYNIDQTSL